MIKSRKQSLIVIGVFALVMLLTTVTYAFFNYTRTGVSNIIKVGRITFNSSQNGNINLTNVFPISSSEATGENPNYAEVAIEIVGDTDYTDGIEYVVTATNVNMVVAGKQIPLTLEVSVDGKDGKTLGTLETGDYYTNRDNYTVSKYKIEYDGELEEGDHIIVGYIAPNTTSGTAEGIGGVINIKAYIDASKVLVTDTYDGTGSGINGTSNSLAEGKTIFTTTEWNSMKENPRSFKIKVEANEGIWVENPKELRNVIVRKAPTVNYIASYNDFIASDQSYSTYTTQDTVGVNNNNKQEVYYYTSNQAKENSNVLFAGYCWQIVRTTDNGGVRLIYNGEAIDNKCETSRSGLYGLYGSYSSSTYLTNIYNFTPASVFGKSYSYDVETLTFTLEDTTDLPSSWNEGDTNNNGIIDYKELIGTYTCKSAETTCSDLYYIVDYYDSNRASIIKYTVSGKPNDAIGIVPYNAYDNSPAKVGYMYNEVYKIYFGDSSNETFATATWDSTNSQYVLSDGSGNTSPDSSHHYTVYCNAYANSQCTSVDNTKINYFLNSDYYIVLENGEMIDDAIYKMTGNGSIETKIKNSDYVLNKNNSAIKNVLDNWYKKNMTEYTSYLDNNAVYCNDRSISDLGSWDGTSQSLEMRFNQYTINKNLNCINETDRFSVSNSKARLTYPIGLLTEPERGLAALSTTYEYWLGSPYAAFLANMRVVSSSSDYSSASNVINGKGARPVITLKPGTRIEDGTGTYNNPYIVGPIVQRDN